MARFTSHLLAAGLGWLALGCGDNTHSAAPTSPDFAPTTAGCAVSTARGLVGSLFPSSVRQRAKNLLQVIQDSGPRSAAATEAGFDLLALVATYGPGSPQNGSAFANAVIPCQNVGAVTLPIDFVPALGGDGAFEVRGATGEKTAAVSHDVLWGLEPPLNTAVTPAVRRSWNDITHPASSGVTTKRFLAYGMPVDAPGFTHETLVGTVFDWFTIPTLGFDPAVVVGTCIDDDSGSEFLIQHYPADAGGQIVPGATPSFCPAVASSFRKDDGWSLLAVTRRVFDLFRPQPLLAAALRIRPPGGSIGALSPSAAIDPGTITLTFNGTVADGKTGVPLAFKAVGNPPVSVTVRPGSGKTPMDGVRVRLIATTNLGATVVATGNTATTNDGLASFPNLTINKAGGYRLIATLDGFGQTPAAGYDFSNETSNGFNLKRSR